MDPKAGPAQFQPYAPVAPYPPEGPAAYPLYPPGPPYYHPTGKEEMWRQWGMGFVALCQALPLDTELALRIRLLIKLIHLLNRRVTVAQLQNIHSLKFSSQHLQLTDLS